MLLILQVLLLLSPQQKELLAMVRQGDMFAADELVQSVCKLPDDERGQAITSCQKKLRGGKTRAHELVLEGLDRCKPAAAKSESKDKDQDKPAEASQAPDKKATDTPAAEKNKPAAESKTSKTEDTGTPKPEEARTQRPLRPVVSDAESGRRTPVKASPDRKAPAENASKSKADGPAAKAPTATEDDGLPDGDDALDSKRSARKARRDQRRRGREEKPAARATKPVEPEIAEIVPPQEETRVAVASSAETEDGARMPAPVATAQSIGDIDGRAAVREAMAFYSIGGGFVAVAVVSYAGAAALLGNGAFQHLQLEPVTDPSLTTADGRTAQEVYDARVMEIWSAAGLLAGLAAVSATAEIIAGFVLMNEGGDRVEGF